MACFFLLSGHLERPVSVFLVLCPYCGILTRPWKPTLCQLIIIQIGGQRQNCQQFSSTFTHLCFLNQELGSFSFYYVWGRKHRHDYKKTEEESEHASLCVAGKEDDRGREGGQRYQGCAFCPSNGFSVLETGVPSHEKQGRKIFHFLKKLKKSLPQLDLAQVSTATRGLLITNKEKYSEKKGGQTS